ncbi:hypothetical protein CC2G_002198 [Coprinopsis cinerea AmutBmut pab1-1]|nr:hypothetical protein CC2G_002198 [Coprinopsis cinerea AmutBmut pab1-1]
MPQTYDDDELGYDPGEEYEEEEVIDEDSFEDEDEDMGSEEEWEDEEEDGEEEEVSDVGDDDQGSGEGSSGDDDADVAHSGYEFTASQVAYLKTRLPQYREGTAKRKRHLVSMSAKNIISELYAISGKQQSRAKKKLVTKAVKSWFEGRVKSLQAKAKKTIWGGRYYGQLVFKRERTRIVQYLADLITRGSPLPDLRRLIDHEDEFLGDRPGEDSDGEEGDAPSAPTKKTPKAFTKFQTAASMLWKVLSRKEKQVWEAKAKAWKEATPPPEQQRKAAEKFASKRLLAFSEGLLKEMNARLHILVAFENSKGRPVAFDFELSGGNAGARGQAFRDLYDQQLKEMGLLELWKDFAADVFLDPLEQEEEALSRRMAKRALMKFKRNEFNEPLVPSISEKSGSEKRSIWLTHFLRSFLTIHYNIARGDPGGRTPVPWRRLALNVRRFISPRFLPDHLAELLQEPSQMSTSDREKLYRFWRKRQNNPEVDNVFEFKAYWDRKSKTYIPRPNRGDPPLNGVAAEEPREGEDDDEGAGGDWEPEDVRPPTPRTKKPSKKSKKKKKRVEKVPAPVDEEGSGWDGLDSDWGPPDQVSKSGGEQGQAGNDDRVSLASDDELSPWDGVDSDWGSGGREEPHGQAQIERHTTPSPRRSVQPREDDFSPRNAQAGIDGGLSDERHSRDNRGPGEMEESDEEENDELPDIHNMRPSLQRRSPSPEDSGQVQLRRSTRPHKARKLDFFETTTPVTRSRRQVEDAGKRVTRSAAAKKTGDVSQPSRPTAANAGRKRKSGEPDDKRASSKKRKVNTKASSAAPARGSGASQPTNAKTTKAKSRTSRR